MGPLFRLALLLLLLKWAYTRGLFQFNATTWHIPWGQMPISEGWHIIPPCRFSPLSLLFPILPSLRSRKLLSSSSLCFCRGWGIPSPCGHCCV